MTQHTPTQLTEIAPRTAAQVATRKRAHALRAAVIKAFAETRHPGKTLAVGVIMEYAANDMTGADFRMALEMLVDNGDVTLGYSESNLNHQLFRGVAYNMITIP